MSTRLFSRALLLAGLLALPSLAVAQERQVTGVVTKSAGGAPIADALVNISGALRGHIKTTAEGRYTISVPNAAVSLTFRAIGFQRKEIVVPVSQGTVNVALDADIFKLEEAQSATSTDSPRPAPDLSASSGRICSENSCSRGSRSPTSPFALAYRFCSPTFTLSRNAGGVG